MMQLGKSLLYGALQIIIVLFVVYLAGLWQTRNMLPVDAEVAIPDHTLVSLEGQVLPLVNKNGPTLVYFFAPWCTVCSLSIGKLSALDVDNVNVVAVALDYSQVEEVENFVAEHEVTQTVLLGTNNTQALFNVPGYPSYYLVDETGQIVARSFGLNSGISIKLNTWLNQL